MFALLSAGMESGYSRLVGEHQKLLTLVLKKPKCPVLGSTLIYRNRNIYTVVRKIARISMEYSTLCP